MSDQGWKSVREQHRVLSHRCRAYLHDHHCRHPHYHHHHHHALSHHQCHHHYHQCHHHQGRQSSDQIQDVHEKSLDEWWKNEHTQTACRLHPLHCHHLHCHHLHSHHSHHVVEEMPKEADCLCYLFSLSERMARVQRDWWALQRVLMKMKQVAVAERLLAAMMDHGCIARIQTTCVCV